MIYRVLADVVAVVHLAYVGFVVLGLIVIPLGAWLGWSFARNFWFRSVHLAAIVIVAGQAVAGVLCPLTVWERRLRLAGGDQPQAGTFVGRLVHSVLFFELPGWVFTLSYVLVAAIVLLTLVLVPPRWPWQHGQ